MRLKRTMAVLACSTVAFGAAACGSNDSAAGNAATDTMAMGSTMTETQMQTTAAAADLRVTLDRLLGEHAMLAVFAMQKGVDGDADFDAIAAALDQNTVDLGAAIGSVYGPEAEKGFLKLWRAHVGFFVDYTVATAKGDTAGQKQAIKNLDGYRAGFAGFLAQANPNIQAEPIAAGLQMHVRQLTTALTTYKSGKYDLAYKRVREAYGHMFMTGDTLAAAIAAQYPERFGG